MRTGERHGVPAGVSLLRSRDLLWVRCPAFGLLTPRDQPQDYFIRYQQLETVGFGGARLGLRGLSIPWS
jgi:hypothetical protein